MKNIIVELDKASAHLEFIYNYYDDLRGNDTLILENVLEVYRIIKHTKNKVLEEIITLEQQEIVVNEKS